jgi:hypothetical protein
MEFDRGTPEAAIHWDPDKKSLTSETTHDLSAGIIGLQGRIFGGSDVFVRGLPDDVAPYLTRRLTVIAPDEAAALEVLGQDEDAFRFRDRDGILTVNENRQTEFDFSDETYTEVRGDQNTVVITPEDGPTVVQSGKYTIISSDSSIVIGGDGTDTHTYIGGRPKEDPLKRAVEVGIPAGTEVEIEHDSGHVKTEGLHGNLKLQSMGAAEITGHRGSVDVEADKGVTVSDHKGDLEAESWGSNVEVDGLEGHLAAKSTRGNIILKNAAVSGNENSAHSVFGDVHFEGAQDTIVWSFAPETPTFESPAFTPVEHEEMGTRDNRGHKVGGYLGEPQNENVIALISERGRVRIQKHESSS